MWFLKQEYLSVSISLCKLSVFAFLIYSIYSIEIKNLHFYFNVVEVLQGICSLKSLRPEAIQKFQSNFGSFGL